MEYLVLDIETIPDAELLPEVYDPEKFLAPAHHKIVVIGMMLFNEHIPQKIGIVGGEEQDIIHKTVLLVSSRQPCLVTFNGRGFDLPVIATRCLKYCIPFPYYYQNRDVRYRYSSAGHLDLMDFVADFGAAKSSSLGTLSKLCGMPGKLGGVCGKDVEQYINDGKIQEVENYCLCDVAQTSAIFLRVQLIRGAISQAQYGDGMEALVQIIRQDARLSALSAVLNIQ